MNAYLSRLLALAAALLLAPATLPAQAGINVTATGDRALTATHVPVGPGAADWRTNPIWEQAQPATGFMQREPVEGAPASERTEVRVLYDDAAIYVGAWLYDADADRIVPGERRRDADLGSSDSFRLVFDTYDDDQNGFVFGTNPSGIEHDGQVTGEGRAGGGRAGGGGGGGGRAEGGAQGGFSINWDGSWTVQTDRDEEGWYAFFRVPFSTLRYGSGSTQDWGLNFSRIIGRKNEEVVWSPIPRQYDLYRVSNAGRLEELEVPAQRLLTFTPYALVSAQEIPAHHQGVDYPYELGGDLKFGVTQSLTLDLTLNTDFAQVEVDEQQVDLTRFSLLFPEKRPFFLENAGRFAVGNNRSAQMFFSRRIGISEGGAPVPIVAGGRLTGRTAGVDVGVLHMQTENADEIQPTTNWSVARLSRELPNRSKIGMIFTNRTAMGVENDYGRTFALDGNLGIGPYFDVEGVVGGVDRPGIESGREAIILSANYRSRDWQFGALYDQIGENFDPEIGYLRRGNFRQFGGTMWHFFRPASIPSLREIRPHLNYDIGYTLGTTFKETELLHFHLPVVWESGAQLAVSADRAFDGLSKPYGIAPGISIPSGDYQGWVFASNFNTSAQKPVAFRADVLAGDFFSGTRKGVSGSVSFREGSTLAGQVSLSHDVVDLAEGSFAATLARVRVAYSFSPSIFVQSLIQYGSQTDIWSGNVRFGWVNTAGTGLFLVYNQRQRVEGIVGPLERSVLLKYTRQFDLAHMGDGWFD